jgi:hypothetical protein
MTESEESSYPPEIQRVVDELLSSTGCDGGIVRYLFTGGREGGKSEQFCVHEAPTRYAPPHGWRAQGRGNVANRDPGFSRRRGVARG